MRGAAGSCGCLAHASRHLEHARYARLEAAIVRRDDERRIAAARGIDEHLGEVLAIDHDLARARQEKARDEMEERRLAAAGGAHDEDVLSRLEGELVEPHDILTVAITEAQAFDSNHRR